MKRPTITRRDVLKGSTAFAASSAFASVASAAPAASAVTPQLIEAASFDELIEGLKEKLELTVFLITHDLDTLWAICDRVAVLADQKVVAVGTIEELLALDHPWIQEYFNGPRGRAAHAGVKGQ